MHVSPLSSSVKSSVASGSSFAWSSCYHKRAEWLRTSYAEHLPKRIASLSAVPVPRAATSAGRDAV